MSYTSITLFLSSLSLAISFEGLENFKCHSSLSFAIIVFCFQNHMFLQLELFPVYRLQSFLPSLFINEKDTLVNLSTYLRVIIFKFGSLLIIKGSTLTCSALHSFPLTSFIIGIISGVKLEFGNRFPILFSFNISF